jgi:hypothetical protein
MAAQVIVGPAVVLRRNLEFLPALEPTAVEVVEAMLPPEFLMVVQEAPKTFGPIQEQAANMVRAAAEGEVPQ